MTINTMLDAGRKRYRKLFHFQLDLNKPDEREIAHEINELKQKRSFSRTVRDGIRLVLDLRKGRVEVLQELFPWVLEQAIFAPEETPIESSEDLLKSQIEHLEELKRLISSGAAMPASTLPAPASAFRSAQNDSKNDAKNGDDGLEIEEKEVGEDHNPLWNMVIKRVLSFGNPATLDDEKIWYGIRNKRIDANSLLKQNQIQLELLVAGVKAGKLDPLKLEKKLLSGANWKKLKPLLPANETGANTIAGSDVEFEAPDFDDMDDLEI